jgi:polysaccharide biosynthesis protein PslG
MCSVPASASAAGGTPDGFFGVNPGDLFKLPETKWDRNLQTIADDGVQVVRMGAWWSDLEPGPPVNGHHTYSWSDVDKQVVALARNGLQWEPLLCFSATWGSKVDGDYSAAPRGEENFALFAAALAKRYGPDGGFWVEHPELPKLPVSAYEIWNEENAKVYWHPSTPEDYADLYAASRNAIRSVDPRARVVLGGLAASNGGSVIAPEDFLRAMYAHRPDLKGNVDAVGFHPYAQDPQSVYAKIAAFRQELDDIAGPGVPLELTEIGWTTVDVSETERADYMRDVTSTLAHSDCDVERVSAYAWIGPEQNASDREQWFGIAHADGSNKPTADAYEAAVKRARADAGDTVRICSNQGPDRDIRPRSALKKSAKAAKLKLRVKVRRHPRKSGRLIVKTSCSKGCLVRVELRATRPKGQASATRLKTVSSKARSRSRTFRIKYARGASRLRLKVTAITGAGQKATRRITVRVG